MDPQDLPGFAAEALKLIYTLSVTYLRQAEMTNNAPPFELPDENSSNRMCGDAVIRNDPVAQYRLGLRARRLFDRGYERLEAEEEAGNEDWPWMASDAMDWLLKATGAFGLNMNGIRLSRNHAVRFPEAWFELGRLYLDGIGVKRDTGVERNVELALDIFEVVAEYVPDAAAMLGIFALTGQVTSSWDHVLGEFTREGDAIARLEYAANHAHPGALNALAAAYADGDGVPTNDVRAAEYMRAAADAGFPVAKLNLAQFIVDGRAEPRSKTELEDLLRDAEVAGLNEVYALRFRMHRDGTHAARDPKAGHEYLEKGCETGNPKCLLTWAEWSAQHVGTERDVGREANYLMHIIDNRNASVSEVATAKSLLELTLDAFRDDVVARIKALRLGPSEAGIEDVQNRLCIIGMMMEPPPTDDTRWSRFGDRARFRWLGYAKALDACRAVMTGSGLPRDLREFVAIEQEHTTTQNEGRRRVRQLLPGVLEWFLAPSAPARPGPQPVRGHAAARPGRNEPCPCGSGLKYKKCCM